MSPLSLPRPPPPFSFHGRQWRTDGQESGLAFLQNTRSCLNRSCMFTAPVAIVCGIWRSRLTHCEGGDCRGSVGVCGRVSPLVFSGVFGYNPNMVVQVSKSSNKPESSTEVRPLNHDEFFTGTFSRKRLAKAFLRIALPSELLECLDLDGLTAEPRHITDELFKKLIAVIRNHRKQSKSIRRRVICYRMSV